MERVMSLLLNHFSGYPNVDVDLVLIGKNRLVKYNIPQSIVIHKPDWDFKNHNRNVGTIKTLFFIRKTINKIKPDVVLSFGEMWNNLVLLSLMGTSFPVFVSDRSMPNKNLGRLQNKLRNWLYPKAAGFIAQTEKSAIVASRFGWNKNIKIIGNPVPRIDVGRPRGKQILTVGRLIKTKNVDRLISMYANIQTEFEDWKLCVVGGNAAGGRILEDLSSQVERLSLSESVRLEGEKSNIMDYFRESEVFAFTSTSEGFPNALAEAMSAGLAVIAYDCMAGPSDLIDDGINGYLIPENNETMFQEKLSKLLSNPDLRKSFGDSAKEKMKTFHEAEIAKAFYDFITEKEE